MNFDDKNRLIIGIFMSITIYGIKNCNSMKKAFDKLDALELTYQFFDYKKQQIDEQILTNWIEKFGVDVILNKKGTTWRKLSDEQKQQANNNLNETINLMINNPSMIKRPIIVVDETILIGNDYQDFFIKS